MGGFFGRERCCCGFFGKEHSLEGAPVVVIIGAGYAGTKLASSLDEKCNVVLIDRKDYFLHNVGTPRGMVDTEFMKKCIIPYTALLKNGHVVKAQVLKLTDKEVHLQGQDAPITGFDYLVIATGTSYGFPYKVPLSEAADVIELYDAVKSKIESSANIVCVGAGSTGLEAATEIACRHPEKNITIVHSRDKLFEGPFKPAYGEKLEEHLKRGFPNVTLIKNDRLLPVEADGGEEAAGRKYVEPAGGKVVTQKGVEIPCDLLFWCVGGKLNYTSYQEHFADAMERGQLKVDEYLQVQGYPKVFAAGDICDAGPAGTVVFAGQHADCIAANILADIKGSAMRPFKPWPHSNVTQLGTTYGAGCIPGPLGSQIILGHGLVQKIKYDCFADKQWRSLGHKTGLQETKRPRKDPDVARLQNILHMSEDEAAQLAQGLNVENDVAAEQT